MYQVNIFTALWKLTDLLDSAGSCTPADLDFQIGQSDVLDVDFESATVAIIAQKSKFIRFDLCHLKRVFQNNKKMNLIYLFSINERSNGSRKTRLV